MSDVFVIQNQNALFLSKHGDWIDGNDVNAVFRTPHKDEAINVKVEQSVRDPSLRLRTLACAANDKGQPQLIPTHPRLTAQIDSSYPAWFNVPPAAADDTALQTPRQSTGLTTTGDAG